MGLLSLHGGQSGPEHIPNSSTTHVSLTVISLDPQGDTAAELTLRLDTGYTPEDNSLLWLDTV